jgi:hypothetical protein
MDDCDMAMDLAGTWTRQKGKKRENINDKIDRDGGEVILRWD